MKLHRNAKTTPTMRALIVQRIRHEQWPPAEAAERARCGPNLIYREVQAGRLKMARLGGRRELRLLTGPANDCNNLRGW